MRTLRTRIHSQVYSFIHIPLQPSFQRLISFLISSFTFSIWLTSDHLEVDVYGQTALHKAAYWVSDARFTEFLLAAGADIRDRYG